jgi:hypothetical protein
MTLPTAPVQTKIAGIIPLEWKTWFNLVCVNVNTLISSLTSLTSTVSAIISGLGPLVQIYHTTATIDFGNIAADSFLFSDVALAGVTRDNANPSSVIVMPHAPQNGVLFHAYVQADDNIRIRATNVTPLAIDPGAITFSILVLDT